MIGIPSSNFSYRNSDFKQNSSISYLPRVNLIRILFKIGIPVVIIATRNSDHKNFDYT